MNCLCLREDFLFNNNNCRKRFIYVVLIRLNFFFARVVITRIELISHVNICQIGLQLVDKCFFLLASWWIEINMKEFQVWQICGNFVSIKLINPVFYILKKIFSIFRFFNFSILQIFGFPIFPFDSFFLSFQFFGSLIFFRKFLDFWFFNVSFFRLFSA